MWRSTTTIGDLNAKTQLPPRAIGHARSKSIFPRFSARGRYLLVPCSVVFCALCFVRCRLCLRSRSRDLSRDLSYGCLCLSTRPSDPPTLQDSSRQRNPRENAGGPLAPPLRLTLQHFGVTARVQTGTNVASGLRRSPHKVGEWLWDKGKSRKKPCDPEFPTYLVSAGWNRVFRVSLFLLGFSRAIAGAQCGRSLSTWLDEPVPDAEGLFLVSCVACSCQLLKHCMSNLSLLSRIPTGYAKHTALGLRGEDHGKEELSTGAPSLSKFVASTRSILSLLILLGWEVRHSIFPPWAQTSV